MAKRLQLRRKLQFQPPRPKLREGLREGTYDFYVRRKHATTLRFRVMEPCSYDAGYCLDRAMIDTTAPKGLPVDTFKISEFPIVTNVFLNNRIVIPPLNPNEPFIWFDTERSYTRGSSQ